MLIKQVQFQGLEKRGEKYVVNCLPLFPRFLEMEKTAEASPVNNAVLEMRSKLHPVVQNFVKGIVPTPDGVYVLVNALGAGEYWGSNVNGDLFPEKALIHAPSDWEQLPVEQMRTVGTSWKYGFPTFMKAFPYKHHVNKDPSRAFGRVELAVWNPRMKRVELVVYLDRALCQQFDALDIIERIERGEFPDVSMGCRVPYDVCTICERPSKVQADYCEHAARMMNKILPDGRKVAVRNDFPNFFDISFVFIGADKTAKVMAKLAQHGNQVCLGDFCTIQRNSVEVGAMFSKQAQFIDMGAGMEKAASLKQRAVSGLIGGAVGVGAGQAGNAAIKADKESRKKDGIKDFIAGGIAGAAFPFTKAANDPVKKKVEVQGVPIWIEWKKGETRIYKKGGKVKYERFMKAHYGYIPETKDADGEEIDVYLGPDKDAKDAYVIKQLKKDDGSFDENKVMVGYASAADAKASYNYHMGGTVEFFGGMEKVPVSALRVLFGDNTSTKKTEKNASDSCGCHGLGDDCGGSVEALGRALFPSFRQKSASHRKLSEIIKSIPAGPFTRETLPRLESTEQDIPNETLDQMSELPLNQALSTPAMGGVVLKPQEFQRMLLTKMGEKSYADELENQGMTFGHTNEIDHSISVGPEHVDQSLMSSLVEAGTIRARSAAASPLLARSFRTKTATKAVPVKVERDPLLKKIAAAYNGYRRSLIKKANEIQKYMTNDPQLRAELFGGGMAQAFAGGVEKVAATSVLSPDSLAYLVGAYTDRDFHLTSKEVVASLALTGAVSEAA